MVLAIAQRWKKTPPLSVTVAAIASALGVKLEEPQQQTPGALFEALGSAGMGAGKPEWLKAAEAAVTTTST